MKATITWILIADGAQARIFENSGPGKGIVPVKGVNTAEPRLREQDLVRARPGRSFSSVGPGRSAIDRRTEPVKQREAEFVQRVAAMLEEKRATGAFDRLILAAAPTALGDIRPALSEALSKTLIGEVPKDLTNIPTEKLATHFDDLLAL